VDRRLTNRRGFAAVQTNSQKKLEAGEDADKADDSKKDSKKKKKQNK
jgi:hypothetical protein